MYTVNEYYIAQTPKEAAELLAKSRRNRIIGGGMWMRLGNAGYGTLIDISGLGFDKIEYDEKEIRIGAMVTLRELEKCGLLQTEFDGIIPKCVRDIVGVQFRNMATLGGSIFLRAGFSDIICALLALDTYVCIYDREPVSLMEFLEAPREKVLVTHIVIKRDGRHAGYASLRRTRTDFSVLNVCVSHKEEADSDYRVCVGARPGRAVRCGEAEECLNAGDTDGAKKAVKGLYFGKNLRGSASYRRSMSAVLLQAAAGFGKDEE